MNSQVFRARRDGGQFKTIFVDQRIAVAWQTFRPAKAPSHLLQSEILRYASRDTFSGIRIRRRSFIAHAIDVDLENGSIPVVEHDKVQKDSHRLGPTCIA